MRGFDFHIEVRLNYVLRWLFTVACLYFAMRYTASEFDYTERNALFLFGGIAIVIDTISFQHLVKFMKNRNLVNQCEDKECPDRIVHGKYTNRGRV